MFHGTSCVVFSEPAILFWGSAVSHPKTRDLPISSHFRFGLLACACVPVWGTTSLARSFLLTCFLIPRGRHLAFPCTVAKEPASWTLNPLVAREARDTHERLRPHFSSTNHHPPFGSCDPLSTNHNPTCKRG